jgi:hypothetical protein
MQYISKAASEFDFAVDRSAQDDLGRVVDVGPLSVGFVRQIPSTTCERKPVAEMVGDIRVQRSVAQELGQIPVVGVTIADETDSAADLERSMSYLPQMQP